MRAFDLGAWCVLTGMPPSVYQDLTRLEREQFLKAAKQVHRLK